MENAVKSDVKNARRSVSLGGGAYRTEEINKIILQTKKHTELLVFYIDFIRNYKELTEEIMENIKKFDDNSKMILIQEYNIAMKSVNNLFYSS